MPSAGAAAAATCGAGGGADVAALVGSLGWTLLSASLSNPAAAGGVGVFVSPVSVFYALMLALNAAGKQGACTGRHCIMGHACSLGFSSCLAVPQPSMHATFTHPSATCQCTENHQHPALTRRLLLHCTTRLLVQGQTASHSVRCCSCCQATTPQLLPAPPPLGPPCQSLSSTLSSLSSCTACHLSPVPSTLLPAISSQGRATAREGRLQSC